MPTTEYRKIRIQTFTTEKAFSLLYNDLTKIEDIRFRTKRAQPKVLGALGPPPVETFILIISLIANFTQIADVLHRYLRRAKDTPLIFKFNNKEVSIKGDWTIQEIQTVLKEFSEILEPDKTIKEIDVIEKETKTRLQKELDSLNEVLSKYKKLVEIGEKERLKKPEWKKKYEEYKKTLQELEQRKGVLEELLKD